MSHQCPECGSDRIHRSRLRPGERTVLNWHLVPFRCQDCKARFWIQNRDIYLVAAFLLSGIFLLIAFVWVIVPFDEIAIRNPSLESEHALAVGKTDHPPILGTEILENTLPGEQENKTAIANSISEQNFYAAPPDVADHRLYTVQLYLEKAMKGSADAQYQLGSLYLTGRGTLQDFQEAAKWFSSAAEQNHAPAQYQLGLLYHKGLGVDLDNEKSYMWLNLAAAAGIEQAAAARDKVMHSLSTKQLVQAQKASRDWLASQHKRYPK